ncbi:aldehyde dehydrogenase family protein [Brevibacterium linens]|uniref:Aldehyde dehydrogenase family protein n=1 Tax=Brevibacterium linens ATCC 9172 TaxID=1255617 RepID=A0A2H1J0X7_BRELN|nr:aldehyde dehydrogenase family protein [Brevibacterium linens]KAB1945543.1 aldehyde dehydrogenase family protein [Brevibacterium linens ATCC 9172]SMX81117.1 Aldehyde dehydrogenase family protein [Brevibacterium linens ATCC 9172]
MSEFPEAKNWKMLIGGQWVDAADGDTTDLITPIDRNVVIATVPNGKEADADRAVQAARKAFPEWAALPFKERQKKLLACADALDAASEELAQLTALDTGNAIRTQARPETIILADLFRYMGGVAGEVKGNTLPAGDKQLQYTKRVPLGVVAGILPWNSPLMIAAFKTPAAIAAGNTIVLKCAEDAPLTILKMAEIIADILPAGVLNVVTGKGSVIGEALNVHPDVDKVSFTGSTSVGRHVAEVAGGRLAHSSMELGGKSPNIIFPDSNDDDTLEQVLLSTRFARQGQSCTMGSRLFLHEDIYDDFLAKLVDAVSKMKVGDPRDEYTDIGCIINEKQYDQVAGYIEMGKSMDGVEIAYDGSDSLEVGEPGFYHAPVIFSKAKNDWQTSREEIFGPVLSVIPWKDIDEVIDMANDSDFGLAAFVFTKDVDAALTMANRIESGWVQVNQGGGQLAGQSYGGMKTSGFGREASLEGMLEGFTQIKQVNIRIR